MGKVSRFFEVWAERLPSVTRWLWPLGLLAIAYQFKVDTNTGRPFPEPWFSASVLEIPRVIFVVFCTCLVVLSLLSRRSEVKKWPGRAWISFGAWLSLLVVANNLVFYLDLPWAGATFLLGGGISQGSTIDRLTTTGMWIIGVLANYRVALTVLAFACVNEVHARRYAPVTNQGAVSIGGGWPIWKAVIITWLVAVLIESCPPFLTVAYSAFGSAHPMTDAIYNLVVLDIGNYLDTLLVNFAALAFYAWKTSATAVVDDQGVRLYLGRGAVCVFSTKWRHVLEAKRVMIGDHVTAIRLTIGRLPVLRAWLTLKENMNQDVFTDAVYSMARGKGVQTRTVSVRPFSQKLASASFIACGALVLLFSAMMFRDLNFLVERMPVDPNVFSEREFFLNFGSLSAVSAVFLGVGIGASMVRRDAAIRLVPLVGVAIGASMLPDPLIYWLVQIAIYAILMARLGPIEPQPWIAFPDLESVELGMWFSAYKSCFAVAGYILAVLALTHPWHSALPSWPYRLRKHSSEIDEQVQSDRVLAST